MSIIIVGIGNANFEKMEDIHGHDMPMFSKTLQRYRERDCVSFVEY